MNDFLEDVKSEVVKDTRNAETLMIDKVRGAMGKVLNSRFDTGEEIRKFIAEYADGLGLDMLSINPTQPCLWDQIADRIKTRLVAQDIFDNHFDNNGTGDYKNPMERHKL